MITWSRTWLSGDPSHARILPATTNSNPPGGGVSTGWSGGPSTQANAERARRAAHPVSRTRLHCLAIGIDPLTRDIADTTQTAAPDAGFADSPVSRIPPSPGRPPTFDSRLDRATLSTPPVSHGMLESYHIPIPEETP